jgi:hypothetical protein
MAIETKLDMVLKVLEDIREILKEQKQQPQTKITVVGNKTQSTKGLKNSEDFTL